MEDLGRDHKLQGLLKVGVVRSLILILLQVGRSYPIWGHGCFRRGFKIW